MQEELLSMKAVLLSRTYLYTAFHKAFGGTPTAELLDALTSQATVDAVDEYAGASATMAKLRDFLLGLRGGLDEGYLWNAEAEYTRLFVGPGTLPALSWESPYVDGEPVMFQESTLAVRSLYRACGLRPKRLYHVPDDHVSLMCAFMANRSRLSLEAFAGRRWEEFRSLMLGQCVFVRDHMAHWLPRFAADACKMKTAHLYPQLAKGVAAFAELDKTFAAEAVAWVDSGCDGSETEGSGLGPDGSFPQVVQALRLLEAMRLFGLEDYELRVAD